MKYEVKRRTIGSKNSITISREDFERIREAREGISEILAIEEKFNIVLENYADFERILLNGSLNRMLFASHEWSDSMNELHTINRILVNLLSTCRVYIDQVPQNLGDVFKGDASRADILKKQMAAEYNDHLGYRVLEAMRNYSQHRALPLQMISHGIKTIIEKPNNLLQHYVQISVDVARLEDDKLVKRQIVDELSAIGQYVDVKPFVREYLECFMRLQQTVRKLVADKISEYQVIIDGSLESYRRAFDEETIALGAFAIDDSGKTAEEIPIFDEPFRRLGLLAKKNHLILNLSVHFISSEVEA